jgi:hypothetical protein
LTFDELNLLITDGLHESIETWISDHILEHFIACFVVQDAELKEVASQSSSRDNAGVGFETWMALTEDEVRLFFLSTACR